MSEAKHEHLPIVVVGAGPAGLSLGYELKRLGRSDFVVLDAGDVPGFCWTEMPRSLKLLSPWKENTLLGLPARALEAYSLKPATEFAAYLARFSSRYDLPIKTGARVERVERADESFVLHTTAGTFSADVVVNATGYYANPYTPSYPGASSTSIRQMHVRDFYDAPQVKELVGKSSPRVLVVGKRISAGQTIFDLYEGGADVAISHRSPIEFAPHPLILKGVFPFYYVWENFRVRLQPFYREDSYPPMEGGEIKELIVSGRVRSRPDITRFDGDEIVFADGSREAFDLVIYATGFRPALGHLSELLPAGHEHGPPVREMESASVPGLFFLGLDKLKTFRSRYLRGIREDARALAVLLERRLRGAKKRQRSTPPSIANVAKTSESASSRLTTKNAPEASS
ncbi:MAG: NAD(P)-binding domain-containing protein [Labilithrix sp.]|nr:NAD(P)-binding domain-containing protein [Labilithrix sp.]